MTLEEIRAKAEEDAKRDMQKKSSYSVNPLDDEWDDDDLEAYEMQSEWEYYHDTPYRY